MTGADLDWARVPLLVLAPHPDDDVLGCSRLMQRVADSGGELAIVWLTDGGGSHGPLPFDKRENLVRRRREEAVAGVRALGIAPRTLHFLDYPDGYLAEHEAEARSAVEAICRSQAIQTVVVTDRDDGHPDHRAAYAIATSLKVPHVLSYPVSTRYDGGACFPRGPALQLPAGVDDRKRAALLQHASQMEPAALYPLSLATIARFCAEPEIFLPVRTTIDAG